MDLVKLLAWLVTIVIMMSPDDDDNNKKAVESEKENRANSVFQFLIMKFQAPNWIGSLPKMKAQRHTERSDRHRHMTYRRELYLATPSAPPFPWPAVCRKLSILPSSAVAQCVLRYAIAVTVVDNPKEVSEAGAKHASTKIPVSRSVLFA